jgi:hypothetical protein
MRKVSSAVKKEKKCSIKSLDDVTLWALYLIKEIDTAAVLTTTCNTPH